MESKYVSAAIGSPVEMIDLSMSSIFPSLSFSAMLMLYSFGSTLAFWAD